MQRGTPVLLLVLAGLLAACAVGARQRYRAFEALAFEVANQSLEAGDAFTDSLTLEDQNHELSLLDHRRELVLQGSTWSRISVLCFGLSILAAVAAFVSLELRAMWSAISGIADPRDRAKP